MLTLQNTIWASPLRHEALRRRTLRGEPAKVRTACAITRAVQTAPSAPDTAPMTTTQRIFKQLEERETDAGPAALGAGGATSYAGLQRLDAAWHDMRTKNTYGPRPEFVRRTDDPLPAQPYLDVIVAGGTLGIFVAAALQRAGCKVAVVERGALQGRTQEWNISRQELFELVEMGCLTAEEAEACISVEFNPVRAKFHGAEAVWTQNVLNLGVSPAALVQAAKRRFEADGGLLLEHAAATGLWVHGNGVQLRLQRGAANGREEAVAAKLFVDCMGNASPIMRQVRHGRKPDGVCLVVGTCARGFPAESNTYGDVILTDAPSEPAMGELDSMQQSQKLQNVQLFWEAFPAGSGSNDRTTYMFTYLDASPQRPSLEQMLEHYWEAMPRYQGVTLEELQIQRILFGLFPTYRDSPLKPTFDRVLAVGDAGGLQSPLSFGGFAALMRHLRRLTGAIQEAVSIDALDASSLGHVLPYNPALSGAWMLQKAMRCEADARQYDRDFINRLLGGNFAAMQALGDDVLRTFLQDVIQAGPLARTLGAQVSSDPLFIPQILMRVGPGPLVDWFVHFLGLVTYTALDQLAEKHELSAKCESLPAKQRFLVRRALERWKYGAGLDYKP